VLARLGVTISEIEIVQKAGTPLGLGKKGSGDRPDKGTEKIVEGGYWEVSISSAGREGEQTGTRREEEDSWKL